MAKTWQELGHIVCTSRHTQFRPSSFVPSHFTFYKKHVFFLGVPKDGDYHTNENTLFYINLSEFADDSFMDVDEDTVNSNDLSRDNRNSLDALTMSSRHEENNATHSRNISDNDDSFIEIRTPQTHDGKVVFEWKRLLNSDFEIGYGINGQQYSKEDELLRERKRMSSHGITSYEFHHDSGRILFQKGQYFYWVDTEGIVRGIQETAIPHLITTTLPNSRIDPKLNLNNSRIVSYISEGDIFVSHMETGQEMQLTFVRSVGRDNSCSAGVPSYVTQEEFDRFSGYWWEPKVDSVCFDDSGIEMHRILYELVDESEVEKLHIVSPPDVGSCSQIDTYRYPRAGGKNAKSSIRLVEFGVSKDSDELLDNSIVEYELPYSIQSMFPWAEYMVRCGWMKDALSIWMQLLDRRQKRLAIVRIPISAFRIISSSCIPTVNAPFEVEVIWEEKSDTWINLSDVLYFLPTSDSEVVKFIWSSESTGYRHLYLITTRSKPRQSQSSTPGECSVWRCDALSVAELTEGDWEVDGNQIWADEDNRLVYFMGTRESPLEQQLYVVSYDYSSPVQILTSPGMFHSVSIEKTCKYVAISSSSLAASSQVMIAKLTAEKSGSDSRHVSLTDLGWVERPSEVVENSSSPELFRYQNKQGFDIYGLLFKPQDLADKQQYPTILFVYGGPAVQLVINSQKALHRFSLQYLTTLGYVVVMIDTMGSAHRGLQFESQLSGRMGTIEIEEQVEGLEYVAKTTGIIDMRRVAIHGWSYGGYLSLMGLAQRPDIFKVAIAGAPVTCWELYDTGYTEKYMDLPDMNPEGYRHGSVLNYISKFPNEQNRLLLIHGMIDENVHFSHTNLIVSALIKEGKPYQLQIYPHERHGIRNPSSAQHYETTILWFLQEHL